MGDASFQPVPRSSVWLPQVAVIEDIRYEVEDVATYFVRRKHQPQEPWGYAPGQFNMLYVPGCGEVAISISGGSQDGQWLHHTIRHVGRVTNVFAKMKKGDEIGLRGPYGTPWPISKCLGKNLAVVAGGLGLAPLKPAIEAVVRERERFGSVNLFIGARSPDLLLFTQEYDRWKQCDIDLQVIVDRDPENRGYPTGVVPMLIDRWFPRQALSSVAWVCGPEVMMKFSSESLQRKGVQANEIYVSLERNMQCAVGFCGHCQLGPAFICKDGPVLGYDRVQGYFAVRDL